MKKRPSRTAVLIASGMTLWIGAVAVATWAVKHGPQRSAIDTTLKGVTQPGKASQPTEGNGASTPRGVTRTQAVSEGPCWPVYGRTAARTSDASELTHGVPKRQAWRVRIGIMEFPPSFCDGVLYVNAQRGRTTALRAVDHHVLWRRQTAQLYDSTPAVSGPRIFVGSMEPPLVQALDRDTGRTLWKLRAGGPVESSPVVSGGLVFAGSWDRRVYALSERTGRVRWAFRTGGEVKNSPSVVGGTVFASNYAAEVFALAARTGRVKWRQSFGGVRGDRIYASVAVDGRTAFTATVRGTVVALNTANGRVRWQTSIPGYAYATPAVGAGRVFVANYPGTVYAFDQRTGRRLWQRSLGGSFSGSPTVVGGAVYVSSLSARHTWALSAATGRVLWQHADGRYVSGIATDRAIYLSLGPWLSRWTTGTIVERR